MDTDHSQDNEPLGKVDASEAPGRTQPLRSREEIEQWFIDYLAARLELPTDRIDVTMPFDDFALDSATAIAMTGDLEDWLGGCVDPTLVYDYPTISELAEYLAQGFPSADSA